MMERHKCFNDPDRFCYKCGSSLQTETEQISEAILEQLRDERHHPQGMEMALGRTCVLVMQHRRNVIPLVVVYGSNSYYLMQI